MQNVENDQNLDSVCLVNAEEKKSPVSDEKNTPSPKKAL